MDLAAEAVCAYGGAGGKDGGEGVGVGGGDGGGVELGEEGEGVEGPAGAGEVGDEGSPGEDAGLAADGSEDEEGAVELSGVGVEVDELGVEQWGGEEVGRDEEGVDLVGMVWVRGSGEVASGEQISEMVEGEKGVMRSAAAASNGRRVDSHNASTRTGCHATRRTLLNLKEKVLSSLRKILFKRHRFLHAAVKNKYKHQISEKTNN